MAHIGYITDGDIYRSEADDMPALVADMLYIAEDLNSDGNVDISDVLLAIRGAVDTDEYTLLEVLRILKRAVA